MARAAGHGILRPSPDCPYRRLAWRLFCPEIALSREIEAVRREDVRRRGKARTKQIVMVR